MKDAFKELYENMKKNRNNCPWVKKRTMHEYVDFIKGETDEIKLALDNNDMDNLEEEIGDTFSTLVFLTVLAEEKGLSMKKVLERINKKFKDRKPWVFGDMKGIDTPEKAVAEWNRIKNEEKLRKKQRLSN